MQIPESGVMSTQQLKEKLNQHRSARRTATAMSIISFATLTAFVIIDTRGINEDPQPHVWVIFMTMFFWSILKRRSHAKKVDYYWSILQQRMTPYR